MPKVVRKPLWRFLHRLLMEYDRRGESLLLNYGYAPLNGEEFDLPLTPREEAERHPIQLYHHATQTCELEGRNVLEVGSGRGGGAAFLARYREPAEYVGLDIVPETIAFCNRIHRAPGLSFVQGEAETLPFPAGRFHVVINIESARCYGSLGTFFHEVRRVLKPEGRFLFADVFERGDVEVTRTLLDRAGFEITEEHDIRDNVVRALRRDSIPRRKLIDSRVPGFLQKAFHEFASLEGTDRFDAFVTGDFQYWSFSLRRVS